jgi:hypothetical protein
MRNSCVSRPANRRKIIIHSEDLEFVGNDHCAAALISYFEYWHNIRIQQSQKAKEENAVRIQHGDQPNQNESLVQFHSLEQLVQGLCGMYKRDAIRAGIQKLIDLKLLEMFRNPNPRYSFDRTSHFLFHPEVLNDWFNGPRGDKSTVDERISDYRESENLPPSSDFRTPSSENRPAIQDITKDTTEEKKNITLVQTQSVQQNRISKAAAGSKTPVHRIDKSPKAQQEIWFAQWWPLYWRKEGKIPGWKAFARHVTSEEKFKKLLAITNRLLPEMLDRKENFRPLPASWLNGEPWEDLGETSPPQMSKRAQVFRERDIERDIERENAKETHSVEPIDETEVRRQLKALIG